MVALPEVDPQKASGDDSQPPSGFEVFLAHNRHNNFTLSVGVVELLLTVFRVLERFVTFISVGIFINDNGDGNENVKLKMKNSPSCAHVLQKP